jgi:hypothetical protein
MKYFTPIRLASLVLILYSTSITCTGQSYFTVVSAQYGYASSNYLPKYTIYQSEALNINLPIKVVKEDKIMLGGAYQRLSLRFDSSSQKHYFNSGINAGYLKKTEKGSVIVLFISRLNSDYQKIGAKDLQYGGVVLASRKYSDNFTLKYGIYYNSELFGPFFAPLLGLDWKIKSRYRIFGLMPQGLTIEDKVNERFRYGIAYQAPNLTYHINSPATDLYLHQSQIRIGPFADFYLTKTIAASLKIEYPLPAKYRIFDTQQRYQLNVWGIGFGGERSQNKTPIQFLTHGLMIQVGFAYRVEL